MLRSLNGPTTTQGISHKQRTTSNERCDKNIFLVAAIFIDKFPFIADHACQTKLSFASLSIEWVDIRIDIEINVHERDRLDSIQSDDILNRH